MRNRNIGLISLLLVGGYYLWKNRAFIRSFLAERGMNTMGYLSEEIDVEIMDRPSMAV